MKIRSSNKARLFILARFEEHPVCDFSTSATASSAYHTYTERLSAADVREQCFYLVLRPSPTPCTSNYSHGIGHLYRKGVQLALVYATGPNGYESKDFGFRQLEKAFPLNIGEKRIRKVEGRFYQYGTKPTGYRFLAPGEQIADGDMTYHVGDSTYIQCQASVGRTVDPADECKFIRELQDATTEDKLARDRIHAKWNPYVGGAK